MAFVTNILLELSYNLKPSKLRLVGGVWTQSGLVAIRP